MASIYNETMLKLYERGELYKSKRSSWGIKIGTFKGEVINGFMGYIN